MGRQSLPSPMEDAVASTQTREGPIAELRRISKLVGVGFAVLVFVGPWMSFDPLAVYAWLAGALAWAAAFAILFRRLWRQVRGTWISGPDYFTATLPVAAYGLTGAIVSALVFPFLRWMTAPSEGADSALWLLWLLTVVGLTGELLALLFGAAWLRKRHRHAFVAGVPLQLSEIETSIREILESAGVAHESRRERSWWKLPAVEFSFGGGASIRASDGRPFRTGLRKKVHPESGWLVSPEVDAAIDRRLGLRGTATP